MVFDVVKHYFSQRPKAKSPSRVTRRMPAGRGILVYFVSIVVALMIVASFYVSISGIMHKIRLVRGTGQIIDVVDLSRRLAEGEHGIGASGREDLLARLERMGQIEVAQGSQGLRAMTNPWGGQLVAYTVSNSLMRLETQVSSSVCVRVIELLTRNIRSVGLQQINARGQSGTWRQIYVNSDRGQLSNKAIVAGCNDEGQILLSLTFSLR